MCHTESSWRRTISSNDLKSPSSSRSSVASILLPDRSSLVPEQLMYEMLSLPESAHICPGCPLPCLSTCIPVAHAGFDPLDPACGERNPAARCLDSTPHPDLPLISSSHDRDCQGPEPEERRPHLIQAARSSATAWYMVPMASVIGTASSTSCANIATSVQYLEKLPMLLV